MDYIYTTLINKFIIIFWHKLTRDFYLSLCVSLRPFLVMRTSAACTVSLFFFLFFLIVVVLLLLLLLAFTLVRNFVICLHDSIANSATNRTLPISQNIIARSGLNPDTQMSWTMLFVSASFGYWQPASS